MRGFSLLELMVTLVILAVVAAVALPAYNAYTERAHRVGAQADLLRCAQGMERHANIALSYALALDMNGDGVGDASTGPVSANICAPDAEFHRVTVQMADAERFVLRAEAPSGSGRMANDGMLELDSTGAMRWDRNHDGDFDDEDEDSWRP